MTEILDKDSTSMEVEGSKAEGNSSSDGGSAGDGSAASREFLVVVHVHSDHAFKKYAEACSTSDLMLYRGLLLKVLQLQYRLQYRL